MTPPDVSIMLCTYNRADLLREALASLQTQRCDLSCEIVVVDNDSNDHTREVLAEAQGGGPWPVRSFVESKRGIACARNRGIVESRGEWLASIDDDEVAEPDWLAQLLATARTRNTHCVGGRVRLRLPETVLAELSPICRNLLSESGGGDREQPYTRRWSPGAGNLLLRRSLLDVVGTYDEDLTEGGEDTDLYRRILAAGMTGWYTPRAVIQHHVPEHRLSDAYLLWAAERNGWHIAKRERRAGRPVMFPAFMLVRLAQLVLLHPPRYVAATARRDPAGRLGARCLMRRGQGYLLCGLSLMWPRLFPDSRLRQRLEFRAERGVFASTPPTTTS